MSDFKDHFSGHAGDYAAHRPSWPPELFDWLATQAPGNHLAWDCATGNGQAAVSLADFFDCVVATDASKQQIDMARRHPKVQYAVEPAEASSLTDQSVDLIVVAQAFHWFNQVAFFTEASRVMRPGGLLAIVIYQLATVTPRIDQVVGHLYGKILDDCWPPERDQVERGLDELVLPFPDIETPSFNLVANWSLAQLTNYLGTWSAVRRYRQSYGADPIAQVTDELETAWGSPESKREVIWPIRIRVCRRPG